MKKTFKRVLASLIAVIMAFSSMPITTFAANSTSGTVTFAASGVFKYNADADRLNTSLSEFRFIHLQLVYYNALLL